MVVQSIAIRTTKMIFVTQTKTGTMVKRVPEEQMVYFLPFSTFVMLVSFRDVFVDNLFKSKSV